MEWLQCGFVAVWECGAGDSDEYGVCGWDGFYRDTMVDDSECTMRESEDAWAGDARKCYASVVTEAWVGMSTDNEETESVWRNSRYAKDRGLQELE